MKSTKKKQTKAKELPTDECSGCGTEIWRCNECKKPFKKNDKLFCLEGEHLCYDCHINAPVVQE